MRIIVAKTFYHNRDRDRDQQKNFTGTGTNEKNSPGPGQKIFYRDLDQQKSDFADPYR